MSRWFPYFLMAACVAVAVFQHGGNNPREWQWCALGLSFGATLSLVFSSRQNRAPGSMWGIGVLTLLLAWFVFQLLPLPPALVSWISPERWPPVAAFREITGEPARSWLSLSVSPPATTERLLYVLPAMATFVSARQMAWWWRDRLWIAIAPVVVVAWFESLLGLWQFYGMRMHSAATGASTGTYVNRDHFAGLLEMALPVVIFWAIHTWRRNTTLREQPAGIAFTTAGLSAVSACILLGIVVSQSRMAFLSTSIGATFTALLLLTSVGSVTSRWTPLRFAVPIVVLLFIAALLPTRELILRFNDLAGEQLSGDERAAIWRDTVKLTAAYRWAGCGLGAYQHCVYPYQDTAPVNTLDFAHNDYLQILAELGLVGGTLVAVLAAWILWRPLSVAVRQKDAANWELAVGLSGSVVVLALHSLVDFNLFIPANATVFAWLSGVAVSPALRKI